MVLAVVAMVVKVAMSEEIIGRVVAAALVDIPVMAVLDQAAVLVVMAQEAVAPAALVSDTVYGVRDQAAAAALVYTVKVVAG
jgi:hypothetical protein